jgi:hypothetical protein
MMKIRKRQSFCPSYKKFNDQVLISEFWTPENDWPTGGVASDGDGIHLATAWPDADVFHHIIPWSQLEPGEPGTAVADCLNKFLLNVGEIYIDGWTYGLTAHQKKLMKIHVESMIALATSDCFNVSLGLDAPQSSNPLLRTGKARSIQAASFGYIQKLEWKAKFHKKNCLNILQEK